MISDLPTQEDIDNARDVLEILARQTEKNEPYALNTINLYREAASQLGSEEGE